MPDRCDICGIAALEGQHFSTEKMPFRARKWYCPACYRRLYHRVNVGVIAITILVGLEGVYEAITKDRPWLDSTGVWVAAFCAFQWLLILPHELGHALAARLLGYGQIRILVGSGKPLLTFEFLSLRWMINPIPFGGITLATPRSVDGLRWKQLIVVGSGPAVNVAAALAVWIFVPAGAFGDSDRTLPEIFFWANLLVLAENLLPHTVQTPFGLLESDGLVLWNTLFRWGKPRRLKPKPIPSWELFICYLLKWTSLAVATLVTLFVAVGVVFLFADGPAGVSVVGAAFLVGLIAVGVWVIWRVAAIPVSRERKHVPIAFHRRGIEELRACSPWISDLKEAGEIAKFTKAKDHARDAQWTEAALRQYPNDVLLLYLQAYRQFQQGNYADAEKSFDTAISSTPNLGSAGHSLLLIGKLQSIVAQGDLDRAEQISAEYLKGAATVEEKIHTIDGAIAGGLYQDPVRIPEQLESWARQTLELAPGTLTLKGTLGGVLTERGNIAEAEPLLRECLKRSPALHDQAICTLYLGIIEGAKGNLGMAKKWIKRATVMYPEEWLLRKARRKLQEFLEQ